MATNPWDNDEIIRPAPTPAPSPSAQSSVTPTYEPQANQTQQSSAQPAQEGPAQANPWDNDTIIRPAPGAQQAKNATQTPEASFGDKVTRGLGLGVRSLAQGLASVPGMVTDNLIAKPLNAAADAVMGEGNGPRLQMLKEATGNLATAAGLPKPETASERVAQDIVEGAAGAAAGLGAGAVATKAASPVVAAVGKALTEAPLLQTTSGASSGAASGVTRENGGGEGAQLAAGIVGGLAPLAVSRKQVTLPEKAQVAGAAKQANAEGYVIPPADLSPGTASELLSAVSGKVKTAQVASARNQDVTNSLAKRALGLGPEAEISLDSLEGLRRTAAQAYEPVASSGVVVPTDKYKMDLQRALAPFRSQSASFPNAKVPGVVNDIEALNASQFDAGDALNMVRYMREAADRSYRAGENMAGKAYKQGAGALEDALEKHLVGLGEPGADILNNFRNARQTIAKTYSVQGALNAQTGNVNAIKLASDLAKNKPLSGELRTIAEVGQAFPKATQALKEAPKSWSVLDVAGAGGLSALTGNPSIAAAALARPAVRKLLLSDRVQKSAVEGADVASQFSLAPAPAIAINTANQATQTEQPVFRNRIRAGAEAKKLGLQVEDVPGGWVLKNP